MAIKINSSADLALHIAKKVQKMRLSQDLSQKTLAQRSGVSYGSLKKFELTGKISLESLLKLALVLGAMGDFEALFSPATDKIPVTLDELLVDNTRKRGRK